MVWEVALIFPKIKQHLLFNFGKYKCLHVGHGNEDAQYTMGGTVLNTILKEKDLGLTISADMKVSEHCSSEGKPNSWINQAKYSVQRKRTNNTAI